MSRKICTGPFMSSDSEGTAFTAAWLPTIPTEQFVTSGRDGPVDRAPDPVPFIATEMLWTNNNDDSVYAAVSIGRASRFVLTSSPNTMMLNDAWSYAVGDAPLAPLPFGNGRGFGTHIKTKRSYEQLAFARLFRDVPDWISTVSIGEIPAGQTLHVRYRCLFTTPNEWRTPVEPRHEAHARAARLRLHTAPYVSGVV